MAAITVNQIALQIKKEKLILGAEMFERDNQEQLDQYLNSEFDTHVLKDSIRLWNNYFTDYHPIIEFAKVNQIKFIATNIPRRYASMVARNGLESLDTIQPYEKKYLMSLPIHIDMQTPGYLEMKNLIGEHAGKNIDNFIAAQAVKDATMAESIIKHHKKGKLFLHFQGNYHSKEYGGIYWYLKKLNPSLKVAVISIFLSKDERLSFPKDEFTPTEFNLVLPEDITKTF